MCIVFVGFIALAFSFFFIFPFLFYVLLVNEATQGDVFVPTNRNCIKNRFILDRTRNVI